MKNASFKIAASAMLVASVFASQAYAAGFQLSEQSSIQMGRAMAGAGVMGDDLSAVHYNPAGMTLLEGTRIQATGTWVAVNAEYKGDKTGATENGRKNGQLVPAGYITHQVNDQVWLGLGLTVPYGMGTDFNRTWEGAERGNKSMILTFDINPNVAWKVNEKFSVGAGLSLQYAKAKLGMGKVDMKNDYGMNSTVEGDSWAWGWNVGMMFRPVETVRLGIAYRSHISHNAEGETTIDANKKLGVLGNQMAQGGQQSGNQAMQMQGMAFQAIAGQTFISDMKVRIKTPDTLTFSAAWDATPDLTLSATARWSKWSNFDTLTIENSGFHGGTTAGNGAMDKMAATSLVENHWDDTWFISLGADYRLNDQWTVRGGVAYDQGPVENQYRMAVIPDTDRIWVAGGASYKFSQNLTFDFGATYITGIGDTDLYTNPEKGQGKPERRGEFKSLDSYIVSAQMQYRF